MARGGGTDSPTLLMTEMGVLDGTSDISQAQVTGQAPDFYQLGPYIINSAKADQINTTPDASTAFLGKHGSAAVQRRSAGGEMIYFGFPIEAIPGAGVQQTALQAVLNYCSERLFENGFEGP